MEVVCSSLENNVLRLPLWIKMKSQHLKCRAAAQTRVKLKKKKKSRLNPHLKDNFLTVSRSSSSVSVGSDGPLCVFVCVCLFVCVHAETPVNSRVVIWKHSSSVGVYSPL